MHVRTKQRLQSSVKLIATTHEVNACCHLRAQVSRWLSLGCLLLTSKATTVGKYRKGHVMMSTQSRGTNRIARTLQMEISLGKMKASLSNENADFQGVRQ